MGDVVIYEVREGGVAVVSLNRPEKRNAINAEVAQGLDAAIKRSEADPEIGAVVLTATTDEVFCGGADLSAMVSGGPPMMTPDGGFGGFVEHPRNKPWIAAPKGKTVGGGFELCLACEMIVAAENTSFILPEAKKGLLTLAGGATRLTKKLPFGVAVEMLLTGEPLMAQRAYDLGLVNRIVPVGEAVETAVAIGRLIAQAPRHTVADALWLARSGRTLSDEECKPLLKEAQQRMSKYPNFGEGAKAFIEKREPRW